MQVTITAGADDADALHDLYRWLRADDDVARAAEVGVVEGERKPGHMGALEIINVVLSNTIAMASLAVSYASWRRSRPEPPERAPAVTFVVDGVTVVVVDGDEPTVERLTGAAGPGPTS